MYLNIFFFCVWVCEFHRFHVCLLYSRLFSLRLISYCSYGVQLGVSPFSWVRFLLLHSWLVSRLLPGGEPVRARFPASVLGDKKGDTIK